MVGYRRCFPCIGTMRRPYVPAPILKKERRKRHRKHCAVVVDYTIEDCVYKDLIENISASGAMVRTRGSLRVGQDISMGFPLPSSREHVRIAGEIAWVGPQEIGVKFKHVEPKGRELDFHDLDVGPETPISIARDFAKMGKVRKRRIRWQPSVSNDVSGYRFYWSKGGRISYNSEFVELGNVNELTLPDDIPSFPSSFSEIEMGVTALNQAGNESDITRITGIFNFGVPESPQDVEVEDI